MAEYPFEPFRIKVVEPLRLTTPEERAQTLAAAGYNVFLLRAEDILIDLLTDSGTTAMSDNQWSGMMIGDESYAGCRNFYHLEEVVNDIFGMPYFVPTHQGRGAETILCDLFVRPGLPIPNNMHFDSTEANVQVRGRPGTQPGHRRVLAADRLPPLQGEHGPGEAPHLHRGVRRRATSPWCC